MDKKHIKKLCYFSGTQKMTPEQKSSTIRKTVTNAEKEDTAQKKTGSIKVKKVSQEDTERTENELEQIQLLSIWQILCIHDYIQTRIETTGKQANFIFEMESMITLLLKVQETH